MTGKKDSKKLRKAGLVPCVVYGGEENVHFTTQEQHFRELVYTSDAHLVKLDIDGKKYETVMKDIQYHPVTDQILHADFVQVFPDKEVTVRLPIHLTGTSIGMLNGGKLRQRRRYLKIRSLIEYIPDFLEVDMTNVDIGDFIKIGDLDYDHIEILDPPRAMVAGVVSSRLVAKGLREIVEEVEEEEVEEEVEEGEVPEEAAAEEEQPKGEDKEGEKS